MKYVASCVMDSFYTTNHNSNKTIISYNNEDDMKNFRKWNRDQKSKKYTYKSEIGAQKMKHLPGIFLGGGKGGILPPEKGFAP